MSAILTTIPTTEGIRRIEPGQGDPFDVGLVHFQWKVRSQDSARCFTVFEMKLGPNEGVPLHCHPSPEAFYILEGVVTFFRFNEGIQEPIPSEAGSTIIIPPNALHALFNLSDKPVRLLEISTPIHEQFFDAVQAADAEESFATMEPSRAAERMAEVASRNAMYLSPYDVFATGGGQ